MNSIGKSEVSYKRVIKNQDVYVTGRANLYSVFMDRKPDSPRFFIVRRYFIGTVLRLID
jgi:hypothetical protein